MSTLSGKQITEIVKSGDLIINPFNENLVQPATYDLLLGSKVLAAPIGPAILGEVIDLIKTGPSYNIQPGQMVGVISLERIEVPLYICGRFGIRSTFARRGIIAFGGIQLDPGYSGRLTLNLLNVGPEQVPITLNEPLFSVEFQRLEEPAMVPYSGPFQDQDDFPADQYNYILQARTTSLAEIPKLRRDISRLSTLIEELEERLLDPDAGLELRPKREERLLRSSKLKHSSLISANEVLKKLNF